MALLHFELFWPEALLVPEVLMVPEVPGGIPVSQSLASGIALPKSLKTSCLLKVMYLPMHHLNSTTLIAKG